jgi:hypothetical protein
VTGSHASDHDTREYSTWVGGPFIFSRNGFVVCDGKDDDCSSDLLATGERVFSLKKEILHSRMKVKKERDFLLGR